MNSELRRINEAARWEPTHMGVVSQFKLSSALSAPLHHLVRLIRPVWLMYWIPQKNIPCQGFSTTRILTLHDVLYALIVQRMALFTA